MRDGSERTLGASIGGASLYNVYRNIDQLYFVSSVGGHSLMEILLTLIAPHAAALSYCVVSSFPAN